jgi:L-fucose isomerase-like protein
MRKPKALVIPFRFREGYPDDIIDHQISLATDVLSASHLDFDLTENVIHPADADQVKQKYNPNAYDFVILLIATWIEPILVMRAAGPYLHRPTLVWGFGTFMHQGERVNLGSMAGTGVVKGTLREMGVNHQMIYRLPDDPETFQQIKARIELFARVSRAIVLLEQSRILTIGYLFGGMTLGDMDLTRLHTRFGPELVEASNYTLIQKIQTMDTSSQEYREALADINKLVVTPLGEKADRIARMTAALRQMVKENEAQALTMKCHFVLSQEFGLTPCVPLSIIGNTLVASCEADIPVLLTQMVMNYLSDGSAATYADIHEILDDRLLVAACGYAPSGLCVGNKVIAELPPANATGLGATFKDYITNKNYLKSGQVTVGRFLKEPDGEFCLHFTIGKAAGDIGRVTELGAPQYPFTEISLKAPIDQFAQHMGSHHYAIVYSDLTAELDLFCQLKGFRSLHD